MSAGKMTRLKLFRVMIKIGCFGFGGGNALIPIMQKELVEENKAINADNFDEDVVVASITPGALPIEIAGGVGSRLHGWQGLLIGSVGMALPGVLLTLVFLPWLSGLSPAAARQINFLTMGISAYIICLLMDYVVQTLSHAKNTARITQICLVIGIVFLLTCGKVLYKFWGMNSPHMFGLVTIHVFSVAFFLLFYLHEKRTLKRLSLATVLCICYILCVGKASLFQLPFLFHITAIFMLILSSHSLKNSLSDGRAWRWDFFADTKMEMAALILTVIVFTASALLVTPNAFTYVGSGILSSLMSFGGGDAYLTVADGLFVETNFITDDEFYGTLVPLVNVLPGSILCKTLTGVGYFIGFDSTATVVGAYIVAIAGFATSIAASCGVFTLVKCIYREFQQLEIFQTMRQVTRPIVSGVLLTVALELFYQARKLGIAENIGWQPMMLMLVLTLFDSWLYFGRGMTHVRVLLVSIAVAMVGCNSVTP